MGSDVSGPQRRWRRGRGCAARVTTWRVSITACTPRRS